MSSVALKPHETLILFIRHAETRLNAIGGMLQGGDSDGPLNQLNEEGKKQAEQLGLTLTKIFPKIASLYAADLGRARETAEILSYHYPHLKGRVTLDPCFREVRHGPQEGMVGAEWRSRAKEVFEKKQQEARARGEIVSREFLYETPPFEGEETPKDAAARMVKGALEGARSNPGQVIAIVTSGAALNCFKIAIGTPKTEPKKHYNEIKSLPNCGIGAFVYSKEATTPEDSFKELGTVDLASSTLEGIKFKQ